VTSQAYQLMCGCGRSHAVVSGQAGERLVCACGRKLEIPPLRQLRDLPPLDTPSAPAERGWTRQQGILFASGLVVTLLSLATIAHFGRLRSRLRTDPMKAEEFEFIRDIMQFTPTQTWEVWTEVFRDTELGARERPFHEINREYARWFLGVIMAGCVFLALGVSSLIASFRLKA
jgi:hypothetical protein